ncbi:MAG TPA: hypothetical protein VKG44_07670 [Candidatus Baltobacteraceae bacterium]|nr:hypothetical protein [Candidatus Baltobacteraceae bacterium]
MRTIGRKLAAWIAVLALSAGLSGGVRGDTLVRFSGQLLDVHAGFVYFTTGDGYRMAPNARIIDAKTGGAPAVPARVKSYARASFDPATGQVVELALSATPLPPEESYEAVHRYAVHLSSPASNPDLVPREGINGKPVIVTFTVEVPARTNPLDDIYMATDQSGWDPRAVKMDRIDALHYRLTRNWASGTKLVYRYTRGTFQSEERGADGQEVTHSFFVRNADTLNHDDVVYHWADESPTGSSITGPGNIPTPFNPNPFPFVTPTPRSRP